MTQYHRSASGKWAKCEATVRACPRGHIMEAAYKTFEANNVQVSSTAARIETIEKTVTLLVDYNEELNNLISQDKEELSRMSEADKLSTIGLEIQNRISKASTEVKLNKSTIELLNSSKETQEEKIGTQLEEVKVFGVDSSLFRSRKFGVDEYNSRIKFLETKNLTSKEKTLAVTDMRMQLFEAVTSNLELEISSDAFSLEEVFSHNEKKLDKSKTNQVLEKTQALNFFFSSLSKAPWNATVKVS